MSVEQGLVMELAFLPDGLLWCIAGVLGAVLGSFASVVIHRLPVMMERAWQREHGLDVDQGDEDERYDLIAPGSSCPHCGSRIPAWFNIPVIGYVLLRGKCCACKAPISPRYPFLEVLGAILAVSAMQHFGPGLAFIWALAFGISLLVLTFIDIDFRILPDCITLPLLWAGLILSVFSVFVDSNASILGAALGYGAFWIVHQVFFRLTKKEGMGRGDFKLLAALGAWLGVSKLPCVILLSSVGGSLIGLILIVSGLRTREEPIPFGPFLAASGWLTLLAGDRLMSLYWSIAGF